MTAGFDERLLERTRIAQDLHDILVQTLQGSKLVADNALDASTDQEQMRRALERLSFWIEEAMLEARAALNSIRESIAQTTNLADDFRRVADSVVASSPISVSFSVSGTLPEFHPIVRDELYAIGSEAIRNAVVHSHAEQLLVTLSYERDLTLRVHDNGVGIDSDVMAGGKDGHFGLQGMRERSARIGAKLTIQSAISIGTDVTIVVPGSLAFKSGRPLHIDCSSESFETRFTALNLRSVPITPCLQSATIPDGGMTPLDVARREDAERLVGHAAADDLVRWLEGQTVLARHERAV